MELSERSLDGQACPVSFHPGLHGLQDLDLDFSWTCYSIVYFPVYHSLTSEYQYFVSVLRPVTVSVNINNFNLGP